MASIWDVIKRPSLQLGSPYPDAPDYGDPNANQLTAARNRLATSRTRLGAANDYRNTNFQSDLDTYNAEQGLNPLRQSLFGARSNVLERQRAADAFGRSQLDRSRSDILASDAERQGIVAASQDVGDLGALAQERQYRNATDARLARIGVSAPMEVAVPKDFAGGLPGGVRAALKSKAGYLTDEANSASATRQTAAALAELEGKRLGYDVTDASRGVTAADLALDQAGEGVNAVKARGTLAKLLSGHASGDANYADELAVQDVNTSKMPPQPNMVEYYDPDSQTSRWVYPEQKDQMEYDRRQQQDLERLPKTQQIEILRRRQKTQMESGGSNLAGLSDSALLNTIPPNASVWQTQPVVDELARRLEDKGYNAQQAAQAAFELIRQEMAARKKVGTTVFGAPPAAPQAQAPAPSGGGTFTFGP